MTRRDDAVPGDPEGGEPEEDEEERGPVPWHFKVMIGGTAVYLIYRLVQGIVWLVHHA
jgi:hypothetical protein